MPKIEFPFNGSDARFSLSVTARLAFPDFHKRKLMRQTLARAGSDGRWQYVFRCYQHRWIPRTTRSDIYKYCKCSASPNSVDNRLAVKMVMCNSPTKFRGVPHRDMFSEFLHPTPGLCHPLSIRLGTLVMISIWALRCPDDEPWGDPGGKVPVVPFEGRKEHTAICIYRNTSHKSEGRYKPMIGWLEGSC